MASTSVAPTLVRHSTAAGHWEAHSVPGLTMNSTAKLSLMLNFVGFWEILINWIHLMICNIRLKIHIISIWRCHVISLKSWCSKTKSLKPWNSWGIPYLISPVTMKFIRIRWCDLATKTNSTHLRKMSWGMNCKFQGVKSVPFFKESTPPKTNMSPQKKCWLVQMIHFLSNHGPFFRGRIRSFSEAIFSSGVIKVWCHSSYIHPYDTALVWSFHQKITKHDPPNKNKATRWAPTSYKQAYNPFKWPYKKGKWGYKSTYN